MPILARTPRGFSRQSVAWALLVTLGACSSAARPGVTASGAGGDGAGGDDAGATGVAGSGGASGAGAVGASGGAAGGVSSLDGGADAQGGGDGARDGAPDSFDGASERGDGGDVAGRGAGVVGYDPCPAGACRIIPLGDSVTDGCCGGNAVSMGASYRFELFRLALRDKKNITFVGSHASGPTMVDGVAFPRMQEGHPGYTIAAGGGRQGLQENVVGWLTASPPDIVTLMIGTNDIDIQLDLANAPKRLGTLIETITETDPKALVVVAQIVPTQSDADNARAHAFNAAIPAVVKTFVDAGKHVTMVDMYDAFTKNASFKTAYLVNALHPSDDGYALMADTWWAAIGSLPGARP
jgi:lysophospholipase L1-like esterase